MYVRVKSVDVGRVVVYYTTLMESDVVETTRLVVTQKETV